MNLSRAATLVYAALAFLSGVLTVPNLARASLAPTVEGEPTAPASDWITMGLDCKVFAAGDLTGDGWADFLTINGNGELCVAASVNGWKSAAWKPVAQDLGASAVALALATSDSGTQVLVVHPNKVTVLSGYEGDKLATRREIAVGEGVELVAVEGDLVTDQIGRRWRVAGEALAEVSGTTAASRPQDVAGAATLRAFKRISPPPYEPEAPELARLGSAFSPEGGELTWGVFKATRPHAHLAVRMAVTTPVSSRSRLRRVALNSIVTA